jgi:hypothetical protein
MVLPGFARSRRPAWIAGTALLVFLAGCAAAADTGTLDTYDTLLARYVTPAGVRYAAWRNASEDVERLDQVVQSFSATDPWEISPADRHALYINLYNSRILLLVLQEDPPESIRDLSKAWFGWGVFFKNVIEFDGKQMSLNGLEKRLRRESRDPRIHFAINCASRSCPPLADEAYRGDRLDDQLDRITRAYLGRPGVLAVEESTSHARRRIEVSKIFDWFGRDFAEAGGVVAFIERYAPPDVSEVIAAAPDNVKLVYRKYDWRLNSTP